MNKIANIYWLIQSQGELVSEGFTFEGTNSLIPKCHVGKDEDDPDQKCAAVGDLIGPILFLKLDSRIIYVLGLIAFLEALLHFLLLHLERILNSVPSKLALVISVPHQFLCQPQHKNLNIYIQFQFIIRQNSQFVLLSSLSLARYIATHFGHSASKLIVLHVFQGHRLQLLSKIPHHFNTKMLIGQPKTLMNMHQDRQPNSANRRVSYFYNPSFGKFTYSKDHPMKPERISMAHSLITTTGLYRKLNVYHARYANKQEMCRFHNEEYIDYLEQYVSKDIVAKFGSIGNTPNNAILSTSIDRFSYPFEEDKRLEFLKKRQQFKVGESTDCPAFNGLYDICQISTGASIDAAALLLNGETDIAINWSGGLHHAKKSQASGFCYVNDIVIAILELLQVYPRVLYLDIDVHHGDGVEEAFYLSNRVMSVSFHQYGEDFFPGTGHINEIGEFEGKHYSLNIPLKPGISDDTFFELFKDVMQGVMAKYRPHALVMQLGADSLCHDKLGQFNLSLRGHGNCLKYMLSYGLPTIMLGGGGYTVENVSRCWAYETAIAVGEQLEDKIPKNDYYFQKYSFEQKLHFPVKAEVEDKNTRAELDELRRQIYEHIREIESAPGISFHSLPNNLSPWANWNEEHSETTEQHDEMHEF